MKVQWAYSVPFIKEGIPFNKRNAASRFYCESSSSMFSNQLNQFFFYNLVYTFQQNFQKLNLHVDLFANTSSKCHGFIVAKKFLASI